MLLVLGTSRLVPVPKVWYRYWSIGSEIQEIQEGGVICALFTLQSTAATNQIQAN